jgi:hypothetical protein
MDSGKPNAATNASVKVKKETAHRARLANLTARHVTTLVRPGGRVKEWKGQGVKPGARGAGKDQDVR